MLIRMAKIVLKVGRLVYNKQLVLSNGGTKKLHSRARVLSTASGGVARRRHSYRQRNDCSLTF